MNKINELLSIFLRQEPNGDGNREKNNFVRFAIELAKNKESIYKYHDTMIKGGVHEDWFEELAIASEWINRTVKILED